MYLLHNSLTAKFLQVQQFVLSIPQGIDEEGGPDLNQQ